MGTREGPRRRHHRNRRSALEVTEGLALREAHRGQSRRGSGSLGEGSYPAPSRRQHVSLR